MLEDRPWLKVKWWHFCPAVLWPGLLGEKGRLCQSEGSHPPPQQEHTPCSQAFAPEVEIPNPNLPPESSVGQTGGISAPVCEEGWYLPSHPPTLEQPLVKSWNSQSNLSVVSRDIWLRGWNRGFHRLIHSSSGGRAFKQVKKLTHDYSSEQMKIICHKLKKVLPNFPFGQKDRYIHGRTQIYIFFLILFLFDQHIAHT